MCEDDIKKRNTVALAMLFSGTIQKDFWSQIDPFFVEPVKESAEGDVFDVLTLTEYDDVTLFKNHCEVIINYSRRMSERSKSILRRSMVRNISIFFYNNKTLY